MTYSVSETVSTFHNTATSKVTVGSVAEWSARQTHNPAVPGSSRSRSGELLDLLLVVPSSNPWPHQLVNSQLIASYQLRFLIPLCYVVFELLVSKYLTGVPVNQLLDIKAKCTFHYKQAFKRFKSLCHMGVQTSIPYSHSLIIGFLPLTLF